MTKKENPKGARLFAFVRYKLSKRDALVIVARQGDTYPMMITAVLLGGLHEEDFYDGRIFLPRDVFYEVESVAEGDDYGQWTKLATYWESGLPD